MIVLALIALLQAYSVARTGPAFLLASQILFGVGVLLGFLGDLLDGSLNRLKLGLYLALFVLIVLVGKIIYARLPYPGSSLHLE